MAGKHLLLSCTLVAALSSFAADTDNCFNLLEYVPPAFNYHLLEFSPDFNLHGSSETSNDGSQNGGLDQTVRKEEFRRNSSYSNLNIRARHAWYGWKGNTEWQIKSNLSLQGAIRYTPNNETDTYFSQSYSSYKYRNGTTSGNFSISASHYFRWPFFFGAEISPGLSAKKIHQNNIFKRFNTFGIPYDNGSYIYQKEVSRNENYNIGLTGYFRLGAGHIDDISFAVVALNMLDRIAEIEKSYKGCSAKHVQNIAAFIEKFRKRRAFDSRIVFMENIDTLCAFIKESGIADEISPRTVLELADQWNYAFYQSREKGFSIVCYPSAIYSKLFDKDKSKTSVCGQDVTLPFVMEYNDENEFNTCEFLTGKSVYWNKTHRMNYGVNLLARFERPLSRYFQLSMRSQASATTMRNWNLQWVPRDTMFSEYNYSLPAISAIESASLAYYPNTRTSITISESVQYDRKFDYFDIQKSGYDFLKLPENNFDDRSLRISFNGNATYYFSPQLQANLNFGIHWLDYYQSSYVDPSCKTNCYNYCKATGFNYSMGAGVIWKLF